MGTTNFFRYLQILLIFFAKYQKIKIIKFSSNCSPATQFALTEPVNDASSKCDRNRRGRGEADTDRGGPAERIWNAATQSSAGGGD